MKDIEKNDLTDGQKFYGQWTKFKRLSWALTFHKPTCTVPDQSMSIQEIIAKFTRTGLVPQSYTHRDEGGNEAFEPDFDPMDEGQDFLDAAKAAQDAAKRDAGPAAVNDGTEDAPAIAGNGGNVEH